jgi:uncharacterized Tic20 family protein
MTTTTMQTGNQPDRAKEADNNLVFSYLTLRNLIGFSGLLLPVLLAILPHRKSDYHNFEPSISDYFYTDRGDVLVVILCIIGVFLFTYKGYTWIERGLTLLAGISGIGVAFVPTTSKCEACDYSVHTNNGGVIGQMIGHGMHIVFAGLFLGSLAIMSLVFFPKTSAPSLKHDGKLTQKAKRNRVYKICGWIMVASLALLVGYFVIDTYISEVDLHGFPIIYVFETIAVEAFAVSWLTKGETLWPDGQHYMVKAYLDTRAAIRKK